MLKNQLSQKNDTKKWEKKTVEILQNVTKHLILCLEFKLIESNPTLCLLYDHNYILTTTKGVKHLPLSHSTHSINTLS